MTIRYSGDVEVRLDWDPRTRVYKGRVSDPNMVWSGEVPAERGISPTGSEGYDQAAARLIQLADRWSRKELGEPVLADRAQNGRLQIRRVFQAPCPLRSR